MTHDITTVDEYTQSRFNPRFTVSTSRSTSELPEKMISVQKITVNRNNHGKLKASVDHGVDRSTIVPQMFQKLLEFKAYQNIVKPINSYAIVKLLRYPI